MFRGDPVLDALDRWEGKGLVPPDLAATLREESREEAERSGRRVSQYALAVAGGLVSLVAAGVLADWLWPRIGPGSRAAVVGVVGVLVHALGMRMEYGDRRRPAAYALQTAGLLVLLWAFVYSKEPWPDMSTAGVVVGVLSLAATIVTVPWALRRNAVMPAVHVALAPAFLAVFLDRATPLSGGAIIWVLDGLMAVGALLLVLDIGRAVGRGARAVEIDTRLWAFAVGLYVSAVLVFATGVEPLDLRADTLWAVDLWWVGTTGLVLWAIHRAPASLRRDWYTNLLAASLLLAIPLVFGTCLELLDQGPAPTAAVLAALGAAGIAYALRTRATLVLRTAALVVVVAAWYYGVEEAGALGAVAALVFTAVLLFWLSVRVGEEEEAPLRP